MRRQTQGHDTQNVAVFFGGNSNEAEISVITGMYAVNLLRGTRFVPLPVYLPPEGGMLLGTWKRVGDLAGEVRGTPVRLGRGGLYSCRSGRRLRKADVALNCCHGGMGEDGTLAALLAWNGIPSASPSAAESGIFMDKRFSKLAARGLNIPVAPAFAVTEAEHTADPAEAARRAAAFGYPVVVKPARLGSSIGLTVAHGEAELFSALELAFSLDGAVLVERYFANRRDINCAACRIGGEVRVSLCEEVFSEGELLSYAEKYRAGKGARLPAQLPAPLAERIRADTRRLYEAFGMRGVVRADFLVAGEEAYFNELNTVPGSLAGYLFADSLAGIRRFFCALLEEGMRPVPSKQVIRTGILREKIFTGAKGCKRRGNLL